MHDICYLCTMFIIVGHFLSGHTVIRVDLFVKTDVSFQLATNYQVKRLLFNPICINFRKCIPSSLGNLFKIVGLFHIMNRRITTMMKWLSYQWRGK